MPGKQLLHLLTITVTLSILAIQFNNQSVLAMSPGEVGQQRGRETEQANSFQNRNIFESSIPRCLAGFAIVGHIIYVRKKRLK
jgi:hypothetical protein